MGRAGTRNRAAPADGGDLSYRAWTLRLAACAWLALQSGGLVSAAETVPLPESATADASVTGSDAPVMGIFDSRPVEPWNFYFGDEKGWRMPVSGSPATSGGGVITVQFADQRGQEDARRVTWNGEGTGQVFFQAPAPQDLTSLLNRDAAIVVEMKLGARPTRKVAMRVDCVHPCGARGDLTGLFSKVPLDVWFKFSIDLACFAKQGADFSRIDTPFLLVTDGKMDLSFANMRIEAGAAEAATIKCR